MTICRQVLLLSLISGITGVAQAQIIREMTPERIREAIAFGTKSKDLGWYRVQEKARFSWPPQIAAYTTPFLRVALAANAAKEQYKTFSEAEVTPDMIKPEIVVYAGSKDAGDAVIANVAAVVVLPHNSKEVSRAIHPTRVENASEEYKNLAGFTGKGTGLIAIFPIDIWNEDNDLRVVFDRGIPSSHGWNAVGGCTDCKSRIYLDKIK